ncbi:hypothetical protein ACROYT_G028347 [Oculina patagonica]
MEDCFKVDHSEKTHKRKKKPDAIPTIFKKSPSVNPFKRHASERRRKNKERIEDFKLLGLHSRDKRPKVQNSCQLIKIFGREFISRIKKGVDNTLMKEQPGFRENRSNSDQIFALRNSLQQVNEWNAYLYAHYFIEFEKAFGSVHRESIWNIMSMYGIPEELIVSVEAMYNDFECAVLDEG